MSYNLNSYYDLNLKKSRNKILKKYNNFNFYKIDILNKNALEKIIKNHNIKYIVHLAAQAGVRYSIENPNSYLKNNIDGFIIYLI